MESGWRLLWLAEKTKRAIRETRKSCYNYQLYFAMKLEKILEISESVLHAKKERQTADVKSWRTLQNSLYRYSDWLWMRQKWVLQWHNLWRSLMGNCVPKQCKVLKIKASGNLFNKWAQFWLELKCFLKSCWRDLICFKFGSPWHLIYSDLSLVNSSCTTSTWSILVQNSICLDKGRVCPNRSSFDLK